MSPKVVHCIYIEVPESSCPLHIFLALLMYSTKSVMSKFLRHTNLHFLFNCILLSRTI